MGFCISILAQYRILTVPVKAFPSTISKDGFWIDAEGALSNQAQGKYWIPPARVYYVEKMEGEKN
jgi:hypothetical protein